MGTPPLNLLEELSREEPPARSVALIWFGQSSVALRLGGATILVDPFLSLHPDRLETPPFAAADAREVDVVLITHAHDDHLDTPALPAIASASPDAPFVVPEALVQRVTALGIDRARVFGLAAEARLALGTLVIDAVPACHGDEPADAYRLGPYLGYIVSAGGAIVYHSGDTIRCDELVERVREVGVDLALLPINGRDAAREAQGFVGNLDAVEAADLAHELGADAVVPLHWDMFAANPGDPAHLVSAARTTVVAPVRLRTFVYSAPGRKP